VKEKMLFRRFSVFVFLMCGCLCLGEHWAVLVAGSNTWMNYRHQADVCDAYQILREHGISEQRIITMMYDDIAYNEENPFPGQIFNWNGGPDVYSGVIKDYTGENVTVDNFLAILTGNKTATGGRKVLESGPNDNIFIYMSDHGGPGVFCFPNMTCRLRVDILQKTLRWMYENKRYKELVIYMESCESGSMFNGYLPNNMSILAVTASAPFSPSYAGCENETISNYLCDVFSINWLLDSRGANMSTETLFEQYRKVREETNTSRVCEYGDMTVSRELLKAFQAGRERKRKLSTGTLSPGKIVPSYRGRLMVQLNQLKRSLLEPIFDLKKEKIQTQLSSLHEEISRLLKVKDFYERNYGRYLACVSFSDLCYTSRVDGECLFKHLEDVNEYVFEALSQMPELCRNQRR